MTKVMTKVKEYITKVLDKGFVRLVDILGSDERVVMAARVSTGTEVGVDIERDKKLIAYLMQHRHETPFEKIIFEFHIKLPLFVMRQWIRHRIASYNERSARYRKFVHEFYIPDLNNLPSVYTKDDLAAYVELLEKEYEFYLRMIKKAEEYAEKYPENLLIRKRAREVWRAVLGTAYYTEFYWTVNFRSLMNFLNLRMNSDAQFEIQRYADAIYLMVDDLIPETMKVFRKYQFIADRIPEPF
ncbi:MAG: FAD-dependent thymidylate synthase [Candidatus Hodarchaeota archaeon]